MTQLFMLRIRLQMCQDVGQTSQTSALADGIPQEFVADFLRDSVALVL